MTAVSRQPKREYVDFSAVPVSQWAIHDRLENWGKWCHGRDGRIAEPTPMFRLHKSDAWDKREYGAATEVPLDRMDAQAVAKGVAALPHKHRRAIHWLYVEGARNAIGKARECGVSLGGLSDLIVASRFMLINRGV